MNKLKAMMLLLLSVGSMNAHAGRDIGNGGDAVVCYSDATRTNIVSINMFDYWEHDQVLGFPGGIQLGAPQLTVQQKIDLAISRMMPFDFERAKNTQKIAKALADNVSHYLVTGAELPEIEDTHPRALPAGSCFVEQFAVQFRDLLTGQRRFNIAAKFYNHPMMTNDVRAGLLLHEAIYRQEILAGATDSDGARYLNYAISTNHLVSQPIDLYFDILKQAKMIKSDCRLLSYPELGATKLIARDRNIREKQLCVSFKIELPNFVATFSSGSLVEDYNYTLRLFSIVDFNDFKSTTAILEEGVWNEKEIRNHYFTFKPNGGFESDGFIAGHEVGDYNAKIHLPSGDIDCASNIAKWVLNSNGAILGCSIAADTVYNLNGTLIPMKAGSISDNWPGVVFDDAHHLVETLLAVPTLLPIRGVATPRVFKSSDQSNFWVKFDDAGKVVNGVLLNPETVELNGDFAKLYRIDVNMANNKLDAEFKHQFPAIFAGKRILKPQGDGHQMVKVCQNSGYKRLDQYRTKKEYIALDEYFYDSELGVNVYKTAEDVDVLTQYTCSAVLEFNL